MVALREEIMRPLVVVDAPDENPARRRMHLLAHYGRALSLTLDAPRIYELLVAAAMELTGACGAALCLYRDEGPAEVAWEQGLTASCLDALSALHPQAEAGHAALLAALVNAHPFGIAIADLTDNEATGGFLAAARAAGAGRALALALAGEHSTAAVLVIAGAGPALFGEEDVAALGLLIDQGGVALRNATLYFQAAQWAQRLAVLQAIGTEISATLNLREVLSAVVRRAADLLDAAGGVLALWHPAQQVLWLEATHEIHTLGPGEQSYQLGQGLIGRAAQERRPLLLRDYATWAGAEPPARAEGIHAAVAVPLLWQDELLGVLALSERRADHTFSAEDVTLLTLMGQQAAGAIANARLYERAQQKLHQLNVLQDTSRTIIEQLDYDQILRTVLRNASGLLGTTMAAVFVPGEVPNQLQIRSAVGLPEDYVRQNRVMLGTGCVGRVVALCKPIAVADVDQSEYEEDFTQGSVRPHWRAVLGVPLISQGVVQGGLCVYSATPRTWQTTEAELLTVFASQAANAMYNASLFERLRAEKATLLTTIQSMTDGIIVTDAGGRVILANPPADRLFGVPFTASGGLHLLGLLRQTAYPVQFHGAASPAEALQQVLQEGQTVRLVVEIGLVEPMTLEHTLFPIMGADGKIMGAVAVFHDITELKKLDRLKSDFISTVSHELRTPLTSIKGFIKLILVEELGPITPQQRECLTVADQEADHLTHLINDLLDTSRIEAGRVHMTLLPVAVGEVIAQVAQALRPQANERRLYLEHDLPDDLPLVRADRQRVIQVLTNLLENALKFTPAGGRVRVVAWVDGGYIVVAVADTGIGIPAHALPRIFERFYQVDGNPARPRTGSGLGLSIAKQLVELMGGRIGVVSKPGMGTTFTFTLPLIGVNDEG